MTDKGFLVLKATWQGSHQVRLAFTKTLRREALPGDPQRFALLDGPVVLAALGEREPSFASDFKVLPQREHQYVDGREWQSGHYLAEGRQGRVALKPLHEVVDEHYSVYLSTAP